MISNSSYTPAPSPSSSPPSSPDVKDTAKATVSTSVDIKTQKVAVKHLDQNEKLTWVEFLETTQPDDVGDNDELQFKMDE